MLCLCVHLVNVSKYNRVGINEARIVFVLGFSWSVRSHLVVFVSSFIVFGFIEEEFLKAQNLLATFKNLFLVLFALKPSFAKPTILTLILGKKERKEGVYQIQK